MGKFQPLCEPAGCDYQHQCRNQLLGYEFNGKAPVLFVAVANGCIANTKDNSCAEAREYKTQDNHRVSWP